MTSQKKNTTKWLVQNNFIPEYFLNIKDRLQQLQNDIAITQPTSNTTMVVSGGTNVMVQKPHIVKKADIVNLFDNKNLKGIIFENGQCHIGASVTVTDFASSNLMQGFFPDLAKYT